VKKAQKGGEYVLGGDGCWLLGAVGNALAHNHVLLLGARVSRQNGQEDKAVTLSHSATS